MQHSTVQLGAILLYKISRSYSIKFLFQKRFVSNRANALAHARASLSKSLRMYSGLIEMHTRRLSSPSLSILTPCVVICTKQLYIPFAGYRRSITCQVHKALKYVPSCIRAVCTQEPLALNLAIWN